MKADKTDDVLKTTKPVATRRKPKQQAFDFGDLTEEARSYIKTTHAARKRQKEQWRGMTAVPPGTLVEHILAQFQAKTNIPLEIPFFTIMHYVGGYLVSKGVTVDFHGKKIEADFWTIVLGKSGAGKTWTQKQIKSAIGGTVPELDSSAASAARFLEELSAMPQALWIRDEMYQLLKVIEQEGSPMAETKAYLLKAYDNDDLERSTKKDKITVKKPVLSILGFTPLEPFVGGMSLESLVDGFAQRFGYVLSKPDPNRPWGKYPVWSVDSETWRDMWDTMVAGVLPEYKASTEAETTFMKCFQDMMQGMEIDESFYRRILWRAHKFAMIYHILRGQAANPVIDSEDYGWAARVISLQLSDAAEVLEMCGGSDLKKMLDQGAKAVAKLEASGKAVNARNIIRSCNSINNATAARFVLDMLGVEQE